MDRWKMIMAQGNDSYAQQSWLDAEQSYYQAVDVIEHLWDEDVENVELLLAWIAGLHNLSVLFEQQGLECEALRYLAIPHQRILKMVGDASRSEKFHQELMRTARITLQPLLEFSQRNVICEGCLASLKLNNEWLTTPIHQFH